jgi:hypothetical protein
MNHCTQQTETEYERNQQFNFVVSYLHSLRYKSILSVFKAATREAGGKPIRVVEIGCAHAKLFSLLNPRFEIDYTGIEIDPVSVEAARSRYANYPNFRIMQEPAQDAVALFEAADIVVALEALEHIPEHDVVRIIEAVGAARPRLFVCSVPVEIGPAVWLKNVGSLAMGYMRHKSYTWSETFWAGLYQLDKLPPHDIRGKGFDWRWLAQTIRHNMKIKEIRKFPLGILPAAVASSVFMIAEPRDR